jgi:hypothetical protein
MNSSNLLILACAALVLLVVLVALRMLYVRVTEMRTRRIHPQQVATSKTQADKFQSIQAADNYRNLFEMPVLFYAVCILLVVLNQADGTYATLAWLFVALRYAHSAIHCSYNNVNHRFLAFAGSCVVVWAMWARVAWQLVLQLA